MSLLIGLMKNLKTKYLQTLQAAFAMSLLLSNASASYFVFLVNQSVTIFSDLIVDHQCTWPHIIQLRLAPSAHRGPGHECNFYHP